MDIKIIVNNIKIIINIIKKYLSITYFKILKIFKKNYKYEIFKEGEYMYEARIDINGLNVDAIKRTIEMCSYDLYLKYIENISHDDDELVIINFISTFTFIAETFDKRDEEVIIYSHEIIGKKNLDYDEVKIFIRNTIKEMISMIDEYRIREIFIMKIKII